ncbi:MAG: hypothetical protein JWM19_1015 [Actinomycetia bacterium]|nr:hypothetical protein [Actinomycetes bacterium]
MTSGDASQAGEDMVLYDLRVQPLTSTTSSHDPRSRKLPSPR